jgi:hypothetical protein
MRGRKLNQCDLVRPDAIFLLAIFLYHDSMVAAGDAASGMDSE